MLTHADPVVIAAAARTPMGGFLGDLKDVSAPALGATAIKSAVERARVKPDEIDEVIMGLCLFAGLGQAPARQAGRFAGLPDSAGATTISKMCGSAMKAAMLAHDLLVAGTNKVMVAGGMESMSNAPYLLDRARSGYRMGHGQIRDHMFLDGLEDAYDKGRLMGTFAEDTAQAYQFTREQQDSFAIESLKRAQKAITEGTFAAEVTPVSVKSGKTETSVAQDEQPLKAKLDRISSLKPAFREGGTVTAANSSSISDGAAALVMMRRSEAERRGIKPLAVVRAQATHSQAPAWFTTAPVGAIRKCLDKAGWTSKDVELYEINEAFAVVTLAAMRDLDLPHDKVNVHGGACALGHPVGASGARIIVTLLAAMEKYGARHGLAALCIGGGEATAMAFERIN
ncbi:MAG: acetyl-CoA C-acyltransferase [Rhodospirillales bacterium]|nr:acetyl-CoA C-acyltransferase [Rhodospirillales bacterium]